MAEGKRYYWLKLKDDFFSSKRIKKLRKLAGGDTYTIIYLKMQLLAMKKDGILEYTGLEKTFAEELALDLDEEADDVQVTLTYLMSCGLAETSDNVEFFFPYAVENVGSEGAAAQRQRECRARKMELLCDNVTEVSQICNGEIEIEKEIEKREDIEIEKREKSKKKDLFSDFAGGDEELLSTLREFERMRNKIKKPMTEGPKKRLLQKLQKEFNPASWTAVLEQSIDHCWQDIYPIKQGNTRQGGTAQMLRDSYDMMDNWAAGREEAI